MSFVFVSIHASVKDATYHRVSCRRGSCVSIHASVKDATTRHTRDSEANEVSIHASVKDATWSLFFKVLPMRFNPRICKRCDQSLFTGLGINEFQSTHL